MRRLALAALLACACALPSSAAVMLIARGSLGGTADLSGLAGTLENGLPANILGGIGSGLAYAGGNTFIATPDRGPNATLYNGAIDDTVSYISRFQTLSLMLTAATPGSALPFALTPTLDKTTLLWSGNPLIYGTGAGLGNDVNGNPLGSGAPAQNGGGTYYFSGRSDNFGASGSGDPLAGRFDPEGVRVSNDGKTVYISDEYGPYVRQFDRATGKLVRTFDLPANLAVAHVAPTTAGEIAPNNPSGRVANKGMEGLALTPDGKTLVGIMQAPLIQDAADPSTASLLRIVTIDIATGATKEFGYTLTNGSGASEIVAINDHEFLVDERDGKGLGDGSNAKVKQIFKIDLAGATDITELTGADAAKAAVGKSGTPFLDLVAALKASGVPASQIPAKIEGLSFGQDITLDGALMHTLYLANDNDFLPDYAGPNSNPNQFYVFAFGDGDLPGFVAQQFGAVPEPATWAAMVVGFGLLGIVLRRRSTSISVA